MAKEIEKKFLVVSDSYKELAEKKIMIVQGYLSVTPRSTVRVRICDDAAFLTVKDKGQGIVRNEWEYQIPMTDAEEMLERCCGTNVIRKIRYNVGRWEIDEFLGERQGLVVAEIELVDENEPFDIPDFIGQEVTGISRYYNSVMASSSQS